MTSHSSEQTALSRNVCLLAWPVKNTFRSTTFQSILHRIATYFLEGNDPIKEENYSTLFKMTGVTYQILQTDS